MNSTDPKTIGAMHIQRVDLLRALAIVMVFCFHGLGALLGVVDLPWIGNFHDYSAAPDRAYLTFYLFSLGKLGVPLFFVISGFCIHLSYLKLAKSKTLKEFIPQFYFRRFWRIYPVYFLALAVFSFLSLKPLLGLKEMKMVAVHTVLIQNLNEGHFYAINAAFWSIAVEWQLYVVYPVVLLCRRWVGPTATFISLIIIGFLYRTFFASFIPNPEWRFAFSQMPFAYWPQWLIGAWIAERWINDRRPIYGLRIGIYVTIAGFLFMNQYRPTSPWSFDLAALLFAMLLEAFIRDARPLSRFETFVTRIGLCSYSIYLFHNAVFTLLPWIHGHIYPAQAYVDLSVTLLVLFGVVLIPCWWSYRYVELGSVNVGNYLWRMRGTWFSDRANTDPVYLASRGGAGEN